MKMACSCSSDERLRRVLMVRRLHPAVTMQSLLQTFGVHGCITGCKVFTHKSGRSAGCASVEFSSHAAACSAFKELQGMQLNGKSIHLQWFDHTMAQSPNRAPGQHMDLTSPAGDSAGKLLAGRSSCSDGFHNHLPSPHMVTSPFGLLASSPHANSYCNGPAAAAAVAAAAAAAAHQQQQAAAASALLASSGCQMQYPQQQQQRQPRGMYPQQQLHRQVSAPAGGGFHKQLGLQLPASPHTSAGAGGGAFDAHTSPGLCMHGSDPGGMAAAVANLSAAITAASMPMAGQDGSNSLAALQQLVAVQQQQQMQRQLAALAMQQINANGNQQTDSPLSPARSMHGQQQQQQAFALAAALHSQQQQQQAQQAQLLHQLSGQLQSPPPVHQQMAKLQLARSMPAALGTSVGSSCSSMGSQGQLQASAFDLAGAAAAVQLQGAAPGSAGSMPGISPFAMNQAEPAQEGSTLAATSAGGVDSSSNGVEAAAAGGTDVDTVPASVKSLKGCKGYQAKKQLFRDEAGVDLREPSLSTLPLSSHTHRGCVSETGAGAACAAGAYSFGGPAQQDTAELAAAGLWRASKTDDTSAVDVDMLAAAFAASSAAAPAAAGTCPSSYPLSPLTHRMGHAQSLDVLAPDLQAALQQQHELDQSGSQLLHHSSSAAAAAAALLAGAVDVSQPLLSPHQQQQQQQQGVQFSRPLVGGADAAGLGSDGVGEWSMLHRPPSVRVRASDSQVLLGSGGHRADAVGPSFRLSSPSLPGTYGSPVYSSPGTADEAAAAAAAAWQQAVLGGSSNSSSNNVQQKQQARSSVADLGAVGTSTGLPAAQAFKNKHKHQLQLELPEFDQISAPLTSSYLQGPLESFDHLITTEVMPESPAASLHSPLDMQAAMLAAAAAATSNGAVPSSTAAGLGSDGFSNGFNNGLLSNSASDRGSAWDWGSMAALLSPMHVPSLVGRRFTDCFIPTSTDYAGLIMQHEQQQLRQQHSRSAAGWLHTPPGASCNTAGSRNGLLRQGSALASLCEQGSHTGADAFNLSTAHVQQQGGGSGSMFGCTRHSSLCLDDHPQLLPYGLRASCKETAGPGCSPGTGGVGNEGGRTAGIASDFKHELLDEAGGLYSSGSFTFQPPVLLQQQQPQQSSRLGGSNSSGSDALITEPFQMPAFFRSTASSAPGSQQSSAASSGRSSSSGGGSCSSPTKGAAGPLASIAEGGSSQQQQQEDGAGPTQSGLALE